MSKIGDSTSNIIGKIASLKTIYERGEQYVNDPYKNINNLMESLLSIIKNIGKYDDILNIVKEILIDGVDNMESLVKSSIATTLKSTIFCGVEPTIDSDMVTTGLTINLTNVDPMSLFSINPTSDEGKYLYYDNDNGTKSEDFNTYLYSTINETLYNDSESFFDWSNKQYNKKILSITFNEYLQATNETNILIVKIPESYLGKKLSVFINDYLNSIKLFNSSYLITSILDDILNLQIVSVNKTIEEIKVEETVKTICNKILNNINTSDDIVDESYYTFSNDVYNDIIKKTENKFKGVFDYNDNNTITFDKSTLITTMSSLTTGDTNTQNSALDDVIDSLANTTSTDSNSKTSVDFKFNLINEIIKKTSEVFIMAIFQPKIMILFNIVNEKLEIENNNDVISFVKNNVNLYKNIIIEIRTMIIKKLTEKIKEIIMPILTKVVSELVKEKFTIYRKQLTSLIGLT